MSTKVATAQAAGEAGHAAASLIASIRGQLGDAEPVLVAAFASTVQSLASIAWQLTASFPNAVVLTASTAGELTEHGDTKRGVSAFALAGEYKVFAGMGEGLARSPERAVTAAVEGQPRSVTGFPHRTAILLLDPLAGNGEETTLMTAAAMGEDTRIVGAAAGDDLGFKETRVGLGSRVASDGVVVATIFSKRPLGVGVCHGHRWLSRPLHVTRSAGNLVYEVDGRPAWDVWRDETRAHAAQVGIDVDRIPAEEEGAFLLRYEAGLSSGAEIKVRASYARSDEGAITFACGIPEGTVIRITESDAAGQIESAHEAARRARRQLGGRAAGALVFDCICRKLILGPSFADAVRGISRELDDAPIAGFETYGEIALDVGDMSGFHNTTSVVLAFPEGP